MFYNLEARVRKFQLLINGEMVKNKACSVAIKLSDAVFILLIYVKMTAIVDILTLISRVNVMCSCVDYEYNFNTFGAWSYLLVFWFDTITFLLKKAMMLQVT